MKRLLKRLRKFIEFDLLVGTKYKGYLVPLLLWKNKV